MTAIAAKLEGRRVARVNPTGFAGGRTPSGPGATEVPGYRGTFGGIASEFSDGAARACRITGSSRP